MSDAIKSLTIERIVERMRRVGVLPERHRLFGERSDTATQLGADRDDRETHAAADRAEWWALIVSPRVSASLLWGKPFDEFLLRIMAACAAYEHVIVFASSDVERRQLEAQLDRHAMAQHRARVSFFGWE